MTPLILYHRWCPDGAGSALAAYYKFGEDAYYKPADYGEAVPMALVTDVDAVYVLDFSFGADELDLMSDNGRRPVEVHDHHEKALTMLTEKPPKHAKILIDIDYSGAILAWQRFFPKTKVPEMLLYLDDRDRWVWKLPNSEEISSGMKALGGASSFIKWQPLLEDWMRDPVGTKNKLIEVGAAMLKSDREMVAFAVEQAEVVRFEGMDCLCVQASNLHSEIGHALAKKQPPMSMTYLWKAERKKFKVSLRSVDGFNVNLVANKYGGGGHAAAAGFECEKLPWKEE